MTLTHFVRLAIEQVPTAAADEIGAELRRIVNRVARVHPTRLDEFAYLDVEEDLEKAEEALLRTVSP